MVNAAPITPTMVSTGTPRTRQAMGEFSKVSFRRNGNTAHTAHTTRKLVTSAKSTDTMPSRSVNA
jgi:hypothetical protein